MTGQERRRATRTRLMRKGGATCTASASATPAMFERMNRAIETNGIRPIVDRVFRFDEAPAAYRYQEAGGFIGKVVIAI